jgi:rhodanese-related sulfurtransferase/thioredoxin-related protein
MFMRSATLGLTVFASIFFIGTAFSAEPKWSTDIGRAQAQAGTEKKKVLLFFHGSDWCPNCIQMQHELIESSEFISYADGALILVDVDFPEHGQQGDELKKANLALKEKFNIGENFPTLVLLNSSGATVYQEAGYSSGDAKQVLATLKRHAKVPGAGAGQAGYKNLEVDEFTKMAADPNNVILDVRTPKEFQAGHLPKAVNIDVNAADFDDRIKALDKDKTYLVHCAAGIRSAKACEKLGRLEFSHLYNLPGGFKEWASAGKPVEK